MNITAKINETQESLRSIYASNKYQSELSQYKDSIALQASKRHMQGRSSSVLVLSKYIYDALIIERRVLPTINKDPYYGTPYGYLKIITLDTNDTVIIVG